MTIPDFKYPDLANQMMKKGINPFIINYKGNSQVNEYPSSFASKESQLLLAQFPRAVHFAIEDIYCEESCRIDCPSNFKKFYIKNGELIKMTDEKRIGSGGFGTVYKELFHGKLMAMKCMLIGEIEKRAYLDEVVSDLEKNIAELRIQVATDGSGVIVPVGCLRQQNQEQRDDGKWIAKNYNIYIYPLYDCNLNQLHEDYFDKFTEEVLADIIQQCLNRKGLFLR